MARRLKMKLALCLVEQWPIDMLDCGRHQIEQRDRCLHRIIDACEKNQAQTFLTWQRRNFERSEERRVGKECKSGGGASARPQKHCVGWDTLSVPRQLSNASVC